MLFCLFVKSECVTVLGNTYDDVRLSERLLLMKILLICSHILSKNRHELGCIAFCSVITLGNMHGKDDVGLTEWCALIKVCLFVCSHILPKRDTSHFVRCSIKTCGNTDCSMCFFGEKHK